jgi:hydrophobe/amphiphile efflux-3 (HAE3) family protein
VKRILTLPTRHPVPVVIAVLALTALFASHLVDFRTGAMLLGVDASVDRLLPDGDEASDFFARMSRKFATEEALVIALRVDDVFTPENLATVKRVTERLAEMKGVRRVVSLANALNIRSVAGDLEIEPFLADLPATAEESLRIREDVLGNPIYAGNLVSRDARTAAVVVYLDGVSDREFVDEEIDLAIAAAAKEVSGAAQVLFTGPAHIKAATTRLIFTFMGRVLPLCFAIIAGVCLVFFRTALGMLVPLACVVITITWTLGALAWTGMQLNLVTTIVPPLLLVIAAAYAAHVVTAFYQAVDEETPAADGDEGPAPRSLRHVALPVALTGLTTVAGFLSLAISPFGAVREFGLLSIVGVASAVLVSLTFGPALFALFGGSRVRPLVFPGIESLMERLGRFDVRHRRAILVAGAGIALLALFGMTRIELNSDLVSNFPADHPVRTDFEAINHDLEGANPFYIVLESSLKDAFVQPENLRAIEALQTWLAAQPEIGGSTSLVDYVKLLHRALRDGDPAALVIPERPRLTKQLLLFGASDELSSFVDSRYLTVNIHVRAHSADTLGMARLLSRVEERLAALPAHLVPHVTGNSVLLVRAQDDVAEGQIQTLGVAFAFIFAILVGLFTSFRVGFYALLPNVIPVLFYFGILGLVGIGLNIVTGLFACLILGIAVDDTIHFLTCFNAAARERLDERAGAIRALRVVGRPVTITTLGLCLGFLAFTASPLKNTVEFGGLGALTLAFAWLVDVTFTPALCSGIRVATLWDALTLDLGRAPQEQIPLLRGLSHTQARIAALMTDVVTFAAGERVCRVGEPGDHLFVVVDGELSASIEKPEGRLELARCGRGGVMGEVALFEGERTADVYAVTEVRALRLSRENLERLARRYPRIARRVFWNLSELLAARLTKLTKKIS